MNGVLASARADFQNGARLFEKLDKFFQNRRFVILAGLRKRLVFLNAPTFRQGVVYGGFNTPAQR